MPINFERLDAAITYAAEHPNEFDMSMWYLDGPCCGTTACLAGTVVAQEGGWKPVWRRYGDVREAYVVSRGAETAQVWRLAADLLGLEYGQTEIFHVADLSGVIGIRNRWARAVGVPERTWSAS